MINLINHISMFNQHWGNNVERTKWMENTSMKNTLKPWRKKSNIFITSSLYSVVPWPCRSVGRQHHSIHMLARFPADFLSRFKMERIIGISNLHVAIPAELIWDRIDQAILSMSTLKDLGMITGRSKPHLRFHCMHVHTNVNGICGFKWHFMNWRRSTKKVVTGKSSKIFFLMHRCEFHKPFAFFHPIVS